jgi:hypothetical protein
VLWQQLERLSMTWPHNGEVAPVEGGDPDRAMPLGQGDHGRIRPAEPQVSVGADQGLDALPVGYAEIGIASWPSMMDAYRLASAFAPSCRSIR